MSAINLAIHHSEFFLYMSHIKLFFLKIFSCRTGLIATIIHQNEQCKYEKRIKQQDVFVNSLYKIHKN